MANRSDDFNRGGGDFFHQHATPSDAGSDWVFYPTPTTSGFFFVGGTKIETYPAGGSVIAALEAGNVDHEAEVVVVQLGTEFGIPIAITDADNFFWFQYQVGVNGWAIWNRSGGSDTSLTSGTQAISANDVIAFGRSGTTLEWWQNGVSRGSTTSSAHAAATEAGLYSRVGAGSGGTQFDDFAITAAGGGGGGTPSMAAGRPVRQSRNRSLVRR
jgi:hypothetical protein